MTARYPKTDLDEIKRTITLLYLPGDGNNNKNKTLKDYGLDYNNSRRAN